jgi:hypothetical protein
MHTIHTGQSIIVFTCGVLIRGTVQDIQPSPWGEPCYRIHDQWYCQAVYPDRDLEPPFQGSLGKLDMEPSALSIRLIQRP